MSSIIDEINNLHSSLRAIVLNIFIIPFWYVAIYLFNNEFYKSADNLIMLAMCIVLSLVSTFLVSEMFYRADEEVNETSEEGWYVIYLFSNSIFLLCSWLSLLIFTIYSLGFLFNIYIYFYWFLVIYFFPLITFALFFAIETYYANKSKNKSKSANKKE